MKKKGSRKTAVAMARERRRRGIPARVFRVRPDPASPLLVEVRIAATRAHMRHAMRRLDGYASGEDIAGGCMGLVRSWHSKIRMASAIRPGGMVARIYLNRPDLHDRPSEIVSHECTHAGMAWARLRRADLDVMPGEEVLAHAVGRLVAQVNRIGYAAGVWS